MHLIKSDKYIMVGQYKVKHSNWLFLTNNIAPSLQVVTAT